MENMPPKSLDIEGFERFSAYRSDAAAPHSKPPVNFARLFSR